jgi:hypothetical protein
MIGRKLDPWYRRRRVIGVQRGRRSPIPPGLPVLSSLPSLPVLSGLPFKVCHPTWLGAKLPVIVRRRVAVARPRDPRVHRRAHSSRNGLVVPDRVEFTCVQRRTSRRQQGILRPPVLGDHVPSVSKRTEDTGRPRRELKIELFPASHKARTSR